MLEFALEVSGTKSAAPVVEHAAAIATKAFVALGIETQTRVFDQGEDESLRHATDEHGTVDLKTFAVAQYIQRKELGVPSSLKTVSVVYAPAIVPIDTAPLDVYGYSIRQYGEAIVSTHNLRMKLLSQEHPAFNDYAAHFFAYTMAHEAGHLFELVNPRAERHTEGWHCCNQCVMKSTTTSETAEYLERKGGAIGFCDPCTEDLLLGE